MNITNYPSFFFIILSFLMFPSLMSKNLNENLVKKIATFIMMLISSPLFLLCFFGCLFVVVKAIQSF